MASDASFSKKEGAATVSKKVHNPIVSKTPASDDPTVRRQIVGYGIRCGQHHP